VSVARENAAAPCITDFWPGNTNLAAVWSATLCCPSSANGSVHARHRRPERNGSANTFRCEAPRFYDWVPRSPEWALTCLHDGGDNSGELDGQLALEANARAYLKAIWAYRRGAMVLASGDNVGARARHFAARSSADAHPHRRDGRGIGGC